MQENPSRKHPAHQLTAERGNQSILVFVTVCTKARQPVLANEAMHQKLLSVWTEASYWKVGRYVIMPDHLHLFCAPGVCPPHPLRRWVAFWKNRVAREFDGEALWQRDIWDRQLRSGDSYTEKWSYVGQNPVRAGLVEQSSDWPYQGELEKLWWHDA